MTLSLRTFGTAIGHQSAVGELASRRLVFFYLHVCFWTWSDWSYMSGSFPTFRHYLRGKTCPGKLACSEIQVCWHQLTKSEYCWVTMNSCAYMIILERPQSKHTDPLRKACHSGLLAVQRPCPASHAHFPLSLRKVIVRVTSVSPWYWTLEVWQQAKMFGIDLVGY